MYSQEKEAELENSQPVRGKGRDDFQSSGPPMCYQNSRKYVFSCRFTQVFLIRDLLTMMPV